MNGLTIQYQGQTVHILDLMRHIITHEAAAHYSPWFKTYYADLTGERYMSRYVRFLEKLVALYPGGVAGRTVLDAGCGFGIMSVLLALMGAHEVQALDCHQGMIETFRAYLDILPFELPVHPRLGDVAALSYDDGAFDLVIVHEAISHFNDVDRFLAEAHRVLRPGGGLIISDSNNALHAPTARHTRELWQAFERGPSGSTVQGHLIERSFVDQRADIIAREYPQIAPGDATALAEHTSGLWDEGLRQAIEGFLQTGILPPHEYRADQCPVDPVQGYYIEQLFQPFDLKRKIEAVGFRVSLRAYLGGARGGALTIANEWLTRPAFSPLTLRLARSFRLLAIKRDSRD